MNIFSRLFSRFLVKEASSDHPFGSDENLQDLIDDFDSTNSNRYLTAVSGWLMEIERAEQDLGPEVAYRALVQLDHCGHEAAADLLDQYLTPSERQTMNDLTWSTLNSHATALFSAYSAILGKLVPHVQADDGRIQMARGGVAAFRAWSLQKKLQRFRYLTPAPTLWKEAHELLSLLLKHQLERVLVVPYAGEPAFTPLREYLIGLYAEFLPAGNLTPPQIEILDRFLRTCDSLDCSTELQDLSTHLIDWAAATGPKIIKDGDMDGPSIRYCSTVKLHQSLVEFADKLAAGRDIPIWLSAVPLTPELKTAGIRTVAQHWSSTPPHRHARRRGESSELKVVMGFDRVAHVTRISQRVRAQVRELEAARQRELSPSEFVETKFGNVPVIDNPVTPSLYIFDPEPGPDKKPVEILSRIETDDDRVDAEIWHELDASATGLGATLPALLPRHRVGALIALRPAQELEWRPAIIRRIGRDAANRPGIGVETLGTEPISAQANLINSDRAWTDGADGASGWSDVIVFKTDRNEVLLPHGSFASDKQLDVMSEEGSWHIQLKTLIERGADYDRASFAPADPSGA